MKDAASRLAESFTAQKEKVIKDALTYKTGISGWRVEDLENRGELKTAPDKTEVFSFDGEDLVFFGSLKTEINDGVLTITQDYKLLY